MRRLNHFGLCSARAYPIRRYPRRDDTRRTPLPKHPRLELCQERGLPLNLHRLAMAAENADEALRVIGAMRRGPIG